MNLGRKGSGFFPPKFGTGGKGRNGVQEGVGLISQCMLTNGLEICKVLYWALQIWADFR
jgi:hypothetical protein